MPEERPFIFKNGYTELILPVTPSSYKVETGINIEVINIHQLGDVIVTGYGTLATIQINCMFPANDYTFARSRNPEYYIDRFQRMIHEKQVVRFIVGGTGVNIPVVVQKITSGEEDGTNDVYADIILREHRKLEPVQVTAPGENANREKADEQKPTEKLYKVVYGDTLSALCRKFYGDGTAAVYNRLAKYNGMSNPNILYTGKTLKIPKPLP